MLSDHEEAKFREICHQLSSDQDTRSRATERADLYVWARRFHAGVIGVAALLAAIMLLDGSFDMAVLFIAASVTLGLAYLIEGAGPPGKERADD